MKKYLLLLTVGLVALGLLAAACGPATPQVVEVEKIVEKPVIQTVVVTEEKVVKETVVETVVVEKEKPVTVKETVVVEKEVVKVITPTPVPVKRTGAWLDTVVVVEEPSADAGVSRLEVGDIDVYAFAIGDPVVAARVAGSPAMTIDRSFGSYDELTFNPVGPVFEGTGKLNPFAVPAVREAMNWLVDREYIAQELYGGMAVPRWVPFNKASNDYAKLADVVRKVELKYAHDKEKARAVISAEMEKLGATLVDGKWQYQGEPVEIILLIRTEDTRLQIGDYVATLLEDIGFTTVRDYKTAAEASPIWLAGNPADGLFHIYTGGWVSTIIPRDLGGNFAFFYTDMGLARPLWQAYVNDPEFYELARKLDNNEFKTLDERREMMARALELALTESERIWLTDRVGISPRRAETVVAADLYSAVYGSWIWPYTLRREGEIGGSMKIAMPSILTQPWNPPDGSNWVYDAFFYRGTGDAATLPDPHTGLRWPQRVERAEVFVQEGLPVGRTLDWVSLEFVPEITVPADAWADWDAAGQRFLTVGELHPDGLKALNRVVVYYPADLYDTVKWHDGSPFSVGDMVMNMILTFDRSKEESAIYDEATVAAFKSFMSHFKGVRILSTNPLVIESYTDAFQLDAEVSAATWTWWPYYARGQGAWHNLALGILAESKGEAAFSTAKADKLEVEHLSYIAGPTLEILKAKLDEAQAESYIPYAPTLGQFVTADEAKARYQNLAEWHRTRGHFWIGTGAFYLERAFPVEGMAVMTRNPDYPDPANKWERFAAPALAEVEVDGPGRVSIGSEATYDVFVTFAGEPYPAADVDEVRFLVFDAASELVHVGTAKAVADGHWQAVLSADVSGKLAAGSNRLEVVVVSKRVALPSFESALFVTAP